ncbi:MAG: molybdopterin-dependent oxidoreductase [Thermoanaerobacteraceae bacterium]|nr:molybdopterin-dependent oxidoreductase [Thermoanaerobacteraceae bacterium]
MDLKYVGKDIPRVDAYEKVTGTTKYMSDLSFDGMLWGKVLRSIHPHALIKSIDTSKAKALPGVEAVVTWEDVPGLNGFGIAIQDQPVLCKDKVRYAGDAVAAVAAVSKEIAEEAALLIEVEYEVLPVVDDPIRAIEPDSPKVHESGNILLHTEIRKGDIDKGFDEADLIIENTYYASRQEHAFLETEDGIALIEEDGTLTVYAGSHYPHRDQLQLSRCLNMPVEKIRVVSSPVGGAFGGKDELTIQPIMALLALKTGKPVKMVMPREESIISYWKRHPMIMIYRTGVKRDGTLVANDVKVYADTGAYASLGGPILNLALESSCGLYRIPHVHIDGYSVYTNNGISGAFRGFGVPQVTFAMESQMDIIAEKLGLDPIEFRRKNILKKGEVAPIGHHITTDVESEAVLDAMEGSRLWRERERYRGTDKNRPWIKRGVGLALSWQGMGLGVGLPDFGDAVIEMDPDGGFIVRVGCVEIGQGAMTVYAQVAAEALRFPIERIRVVIGDTRNAPDAGPTTASRAAYVGGKAIFLAAEEMNEKIKGYASGMLSVSPDEIEIDDGSAYVKTAKDKRVSYEEISSYAIERGGLPVAEGHFDLPTADKAIEGAFGLPHHIYSCCGQIAAVEVNTLTGQARVTDGAVVVDAGTVINQGGLEGQSEGGFVMGTGYALTEDLIIENGVVKTPNFSTYIIPTSKDMPSSIETIPVTNYESTGPFGAKGIGEIGMVPTAPAVTNAIYDAADIRVFKIPATGERIYELLKQKKGENK